MPINELFRQDITLLKAASGSDTRQIPAASATLDLYWKGATVSANSSGTTGHVVAVYDPGTFSTSDTVKKNGAGTVGTVTAVAVNSVTVNWGALTSVAVGDRLVLTTRASGATRPTAYSDSQGTVSLGSQVTVGATGGTSFYTRPREIDLVATVDAQTTVLADQTGSGSNDFDLWDFGLVADGSTDDAPAINRFIAYVALKGKTELRLPSATVQVNTGITVSTSLKLRGAGRGATKLQGTTGITVLNITASDCSVEGLTVTRSGTGTSGARLIELTGARNSLRNLTLDKGAVGVYDAGVVNIVDDVICTGQGWESFYYGAASFSPIVSALRGYHQNNIPATSGGIRLDKSVNGVFTACEVSPSAAVKGPAVLIENTGLQSPSATFVGCRLGGSNTVTPTESTVEITAGTGLRFIGCDVSDGLRGYHVNGTVNDLQIVTGSVVGAVENSVKVTSGNHVHVTELLSSDCNIGNFADSRADHINVAAGVDNFSVNGLTVGKLIRGTGADARHGVRIEAGVSDNIQVIGVRGVAADITGDFVSCLSTSQSVDVGHNFTRTGKTAYHTGVPGGYMANGQAGTKVLTGSETSTSVANVSTILLSQAINTVFSDLTDGREGQVVTIINGSATQTFGLSHGAVFKLLTGSAVNLAQYDTVTLVNIGSVWVEVARSNNNT